MKQFRRILGMMALALGLAPTMGCTGTETGNPFSTELRVSALRTLMDVVGESSSLHRDAAGAALHGQLEAAYRQAPVGTFGGGVNEVQREIIALAGLGMPRAPR